MDSARVDVLLQQAAEQLERLSAGASLCMLTRSGGQAPTVKWAEGRWSALREARRTADLEGLVRQWSRQLDLVRERSGSDDWIAYLEGGAEALAELLTSAPSPPR